MENLGFFVFLFALGLVVFFVVKSNKKEKAEAGVVLDQGLPFPCTIDGTVDAPPMADRVKALAAEAAGKGFVITGDYNTDVAAQGGEMMLIGTSFKFVFDAAGQIIKEQSHLNLFLKDYPVEGGMEPTGTLGMAVDVGGAKVGITGRIINGIFVGGEVRKGWKPLIYGVLNGTYRRTGA